MGSSAVEAARDIDHEGVAGRLAQIGLVARGVLYAVMGYLALRVAFGGGEDASAEGAIAAIAEGPLGKVLVLALAVGFAGYSLYRGNQAVRGPQGDHDLPDPLVRATYVARGLTYAGMAVLALRQLTSGGSGGSGGSSATAGILGSTVGMILLVTVGLVLIGVGIYQGYLAVTTSFEDDFDRREVDAAARRWLVPLGTAGHAGRAVGFAAIGGFLAQSALSHDPSAETGLDRALQEFAGGALGPWVIGLVGIGFVAYGLYELGMTKYAELEDLD